MCLYHRSEAERDLVALPMRMRGLGLINPSDSADAEYLASIRVSAPLVSKIEAQSHETPEEGEVQRLVYALSLIHISEPTRPY